MWNFDEDEKPKLDVGDLQLDPETLARTPPETIADGLQFAMLTREMLEMTKAAHLRETGVKLNNSGALERIIHILTGSMEQLKKMGL